MSVLSKCIVTVAVAAVATALVFLLHPLWRSPQAIQEALLKGKPLGSTLSEVTHWLENEKGLTPKISDTGFLKQEPPAPMAIVGASSIRVELGEYNLGIFKTTVTAFWGFDKSGRLIEVWVWKVTDGA